MRSGKAAASRHHPKTGSPWYPKMRQPARPKPVWTGVLAVLLLLGSGAAADVSALDAIARGDAAYERRSEGHEGLLAQRPPIAEAIQAFQEALAADPTNHAARVRLLRALFFEGDYVLEDRESKLEVFTRGQKLGEDGISMLLAGTDFDRRGEKDFDRLVEHLASEPSAAGVYYWTAVHWGVWGRHRGKIAAAREGVAGRVRDYARMVNALDGDYDGGSGHRMLGRLHAEAPKIPFVTGWIDRNTAISELEIARSQSTESLTLVYFIEALLDFAPARRDEAMALLRDLVERHQGPFESVEDARAMADARALLEEHGG